MGISVGVNSKGSGFWLNQSLRQVLAIGSRVMSNNLLMSEVQHVQLYVAFSVRAPLLRGLIPN